MPHFVRTLLALLTTALFSTARADVIISEFLANNSTGLTDEDAATSDWIELFNNGTTTVNLAGWRLTDDSADAAKWIFPSVNLAPNGFLVVFASAKNRINPAANLHTNFKLSSNGGYLALLRQDGSPSTVFNPYPAQYPDKPYGIAQSVATTTYVATNGALKYFVPANNTLGTTWTARTFVDTTWTSGTNGAGFETFANGWLFKYFKGSSTISNLAQAEAVVASPPGQTAQATTATYNFGNGGGEGHYTGNINPPPVDTGDIDDFVVEGTGIITIPTSGVWSFGVNSDDGNRIQIDLNKDGDFADAGETQSDDVLSGPHDFIRQFTFPTAGDYNIRVIVFERGGGAEGEVYARSGTFTTWTTNFKLVGDTAGGGLVIRSLPAAGASSGYLPLIGTSLLTPMANAVPKKSSAFLRYAFNVPSAAAVTTLTMPLNYDDGFVAYLNGTEVARRNVPAGTLNYDAVASGDRLPSQALLAETLDLTPFVGSLVDGTNVLAIHGLNDAAASNDFLMRPQLARYVVTPGATSFFTTPTPGGFNTAAVYNKVAPVVASVKRGFYTTAQTVALTTGTAGATIYYSFDGSSPSATSPTSKSYTGSISISQTTTLRYRAEKAGSDPSDSGTQTYLFTADIRNQSANTVIEGGANPVITNPAGVTNPTTTWPRGTLSNSYYRVTGGTSQILEYGMDTDIVSSPTYGPQIENALKAIPSFSIVTDLSNLFDTATGIYANPGGDEIAFERAGSIELIYPDGSTGFQVNCGLRVRGGYSRSPDNPKHAFRFFFRESYGAAKLDFPLFGSDPTAAISFDKFDLRTSQNYSWSFGGDGSNFFVPDEFGRVSQLAMGQPSSHSLHAHLYVNGQYWGLYNVDERPEAKFGATYFGGDPVNFDTVKIDPDIGYVVEPTDGNLTAWYAFWALADGMTAGTGNAIFQQMQGRNPDGSANVAYPVQLDVRNLIDLMVNIYWSGNLDAPVSNFIGNASPNNFYGFRDRTGASGGWKFVLHDSEHTLRNENENRLGVSAGIGWPAGDTAQQGAATAQTKSNPQYICSQLLKFSSDFRALWADRVFKHLNYNGALTVASSQARLDALKAGILSASITESARWGDSKVQPPKTQADFASAIDGVRNGFLVNRNPIFISQLQTWGWYPTLLPPNWSQRGGAVNTGYALTFTNPNATGTIYYTLDGTDPRGLGGGVAGTAVAYTGAIVINLSKTIRARILDAGNWSPLDEATFYTNQNFNNLIISEVHYNPLPNGATSGDEYEFIEFKNIGGTTLDLGGLNFSNGITFTFPVGVTLAPNGFLVLARNSAQFAVRYPSVTLNGTFTGKLDNGGERLTLLTGTGSQIIDFNYKDTAPWPVAPDGQGFSLVAKDPATHTDPGNAAKWRASTAVGGSPGADDPANTIAGIVINEVLTNSVLPLTDTIELYNPTGSPVVVTDWWLSDDTSIPKKYRIPATTIPAGGYVTFNEAQFNPTPGVGTSFSLGSTGEQVYLYSGDASGNLTSYSHGLEFQAADNDVSFGRYVNSVGDESFPSQTARTFGAVNAGPIVGPLIINEIQYSPLAGYDEFLEIKNISASAVNLWDAANPANTWKIGGLDFSFPANTTIPAGGFALLVGIDPATFRTKYQIPAAVPIFGPYLGLLDNNGERLELEKPAPPYLDGLGQTVVPYVIVDALRYNNKAPWPPSAAGAGPSLQRTNSTLYADDPANWFASGITPGASNAVNTAPTVSLASPANGASFTLPTAITLVANASDSDGFISKVEFYDGAVKIGESSTVPYSIAWSTASAGSHTLTARAIDSGLAVTTSAPVTINVIGSGVGGTGTGWYAQYYKDASGTSHLVEPPLGTRTDATINFNDGTGWPNTLIPGAGTDLVSVRWSAQLLVPSTSTYNFYTNSDDGVRLYINGQAVISNWTDHGGTVNIGTIQLNAGQLYDIVLEFYENGGGAVISLEYEASGAGIARQILPADRVYPASTPSIITHPAPVTLTTGNTASFSVLAAGAAPLSYQWQFNNADIAGAIGQSLVLQDPLLTQVGNYRVRVTNSFGNVTSNNAALTITDTDGDGIPNYWESQFGLNPAVANNGDSDGDGASDKSEYLTGTDPLNNASRLKLGVIRNPAGAGYKLSLSAQSNRSYTLQYKDAMPAATWTTLQQVPAAYGIRALDFVDPAASQPQRFYRAITPQQ